MSQIGWQRQECSHLELKTQQVASISFSFFIVGNCDIDFLIFCHCFHIMWLKFPKFKRYQNAAEIFCIGINKSEYLASRTHTNLT